MLRSGAPPFRRLGCWGHQGFLRCLQQAGATLPLPAHSLPSPQAFLEAARAGLGWGMNIEAMARADLAAGRLQALSPQPLDVALYWKTLRVMKAPLAPLTAAIRKAAAETKEVLTPVVATDITSLPRVKVKLVDPPFVHEHEQVATGGPKVVEFEMTIVEKKITLDADGATYWASTFNGTVPGPLMVVHEGDYVELTLINPDTNELMHNIDFHSSTGALGGGGLTQVNPGEKTILRWKATKPGVFVYHCAPPGMVAWHVVSGMSGAIMVLPRDGLKDHLGQPVSYDKVYYIGENDFYIPRGQDGAYMRFADAGESYSDTLEVMNRLIPSHVVFNGRVAEDFKLGDRLSFCTRDENSARVDLTRMCAELREDLDAPAPRLNELQAAGFSGIHSRRKPRGAVYIACNGRGASLFGLQGVEQQIVREQLGDIPLIGFSANGEIFRGALYGYTGVLALFF